MTVCDCVLAGTTGAICYKNCFSCRIHINNLTTSSMKIP